MGKKIGFNFCLWIKKTDRHAGGVLFGGVKKLFCNVYCTCLADDYHTYLSRICHLVLYLL